jgi:hypothetical protein
VFTSSARRGNSVCSHLGENEGGRLGGLRDVVVGFEGVLGEAAITVRQAAVLDPTSSSWKVAAFHALALFAEVFAGPAGGIAVAPLVGLELVAFNADRGTTLDLLARLIRGAIRVLAVLLKSLGMMFDILLRLTCALLRGVQRTAARIHRAGVLDRHLQSELGGLMQVLGGSKFVFRE